MGEIIQGAFSDAIPLMKRRSALILFMTALCAAAGAALAAAASSLDGAPRDTTWFKLALASPDLLGFLSLFFFYPTVARTARPEFRMTVGRFFATLGLILAYSLVCLAGFVAFVIPGFWIGVKWSLLPWTYLVGEGKNPFSESWDLTTGQFWETFGFNLLLVLALIVPAVVATLCGNVAGMVPVLGFILLPIALLINVFVNNVTLLAQLRWMLRLRDRIREFTIVQTAG
jgi:hypothetical protein